LFYDTPAVKAEDLSRPGGDALTTKTVAKRVALARAKQAERYGELASAQMRRLNVDATVDLLSSFSQPSESGRALLLEAATKMNLSARAYHRVLKVARTIADLDGNDGVQRVNIAEALSYRRRTPDQLHSADSGRLNQ
jgi:magnesium chelatase family protein